MDYPKYKRWIVLGCIGLLLSWPGSPLLAKKGPPPQRSDVRILIDISGSMKKNDPQNLRRSALRLLVGLMPGGSRAGVWTFGQYVNEPVPLGHVNEVWRAHARSRVAYIHSRGLFTDIEAALKRATKDWSGAPTRFRRDIILLTDGMVDISKEAEENAASRQRIITKLLPVLKKRGARIHTIALSERADHDLMKTLSVATNGSYEQVVSADRLQRVFLRIFEKVSKPDTVPLKDNRFRIDGSIKEATLLIFKNKGSQQPTRIISPSGKIYSIADIPKSIAWHQDEGYDLLTISRPEPGEWGIQAELDPDNRVMVVTDLRMHTTDIASWVSVGERLPFIVQFSSRGKKIVRADFLKMVNVSSEYKIGAQYSEPRPIRDDGRFGDKKALDGTFSAIVGGKLKPGRSELIVTAEGKTFVRERRQTFTVVLPVKLSVSKKRRNGQEGIELVLRANGRLIKRDSLNPAAWREMADGQRAGIILTPDGVGGWQGWIDGAALTEPQQLRIRITATSQRGNWVELELDPVTLEALSPPPPPPAPPAEEPPAPPATEPEPPAAEDEAAPEGDMQGILLFVAGNLVLILLGGAGYWFYKKRKGSSDLVQLVDDDEEER